MNLRITWIWKRLKHWENHCWNFRCVWLFFKLQEIAIEFLTLPPPPRNFIYPFLEHFEGIEVAQMLSSTMVVLTMESARCTFIVHSSLAVKVYRNRQACVQKSRLTYMKWSPKVRKCTIRHMRVTCTVKTTMVEDNIGATNIPHSDPIP